jgi:hypothetical protein
MQGQLSKVSSKGKRNCTSYILITGCWRDELSFKFDRNSMYPFRFIGVEDFYKYTEHAVPQKVNKTFRKPGPYPEDEKAIIIFRRKLLEKRRKEMLQEYRYVLFL